MKSKRLACCILAAAILTGGIGCTALSAAAVDPDSSGYSQNIPGIDIFSDEYKSSEYYSKLQDALRENESASTMQKAIAIALSQEGYKNYATEGIDIEQARANGLLWTGKEKRNNEYDTGNTEYTRWAQRYVAGGGEDSQYLDCDWCAIFASWCLYQAGYYTEEQLKKYYFSYYADPRIEMDADSWITAFNLDQNDVWYTPTATRKIGYYDWNKYVHTEISPFEIPYKPGGLIFFSLDGTGNYFNHIAMVVDYDPETHVLTYINGNSDGEVITKQMDLDEEISLDDDTTVKNSSLIMAYGEYDKINPLEKKEITADNTKIKWPIDSEKGISIQTNSDSKIVSVSEDGNYLGSNIESNMTLLYGKLSIGKSELIKLDPGVHHLLLTFDDGTLEITFTSYDPEAEITADISDLTWDRNKGSDVTVNTTSISDTVNVRINGSDAGDVNTEGIRFEDGSVTFSKNYLREVLANNDNTMKLIFSDGEIDIVFHVTETPVTADITDITWDKNKGGDVSIKTTSDSDTVCIRAGGATVGNETTQGVRLENGTVTLSREFLRTILDNDENTVRLIFSDGEIDVVFHVTESKKENSEESSSQSDDKKKNPESSNTTKNTTTAATADTKAGDVPFTGDTAPAAAAMFAALLSGIAGLFMLKKKTSR